MKGKIGDFIRYEKTLQKDLAFEEAKRIAAGKDESIGNKISESHLIKTWYLFDSQIHNDGLMPDTKDLMKKVYNIDLPVGYKLNENHGERVRRYGMALIKELGLLDDPQKLEKYKQKEARISWLQHQTEWYDGTGYPDGLTGENIPILSRIASLAEAFDIFYECWKVAGKALNTIDRFSGTKFDPALVEALEKACASCAIV